jgi:M6 family metalloprotease-like protein
MNIKNSLAVFKHNNSIFHIIILFLLYNFSLFSAPITNLPITIKQPDGKVLNCFLSGDEFHNWVHDKDNYTIIQNEKTGFWTYAIKQNGSLTASEYIVGKDNPKFLNLPPGINLTADEIKQKRENIFKSLNKKNTLNKNGISSIPQYPKGITKGNFNNIAIFIRFQDDPEFSNNISYYDSLFNTGKKSIKNYYYADSYGKLNLTTYFYPKSESFTNSYRDINPRGYYIKYNEVTNPNGYKDETERDERAERLFQRAISGVENQIPSDINFDQNNDGYIDNICFIIYGTAPGYSELLWPHYTEFDSKIIIKGKTAKGYSLVLNIENTLEDYLFNTICHETGHAIGFPDLYRIYQSGDPVGRWDMMSRNVGFSGAWMKYKYAGWIDSIPEIGREGQYTINAITNPHNNCYKIRSSVLTDEFLVIEYRKQDSLFERDIPGSGLLVTRINPNVNGNTLAPPDEIYYYRPSKEGVPDGDIMNAYFSSESGRTKLDLTTDPPLIFSDVNKPEIEIYDIGSSKEASTTFSVKRKNKIILSIDNKINSYDSGNLTAYIKYFFPNQESQWSVSMITGDWLNIDPKSGKGNGEVLISFSQNNADTLRVGTIQIGDKESINGPFNVNIYQSPSNSQKETEPNNAYEQSNYITPGILVDGSINPKEETDCYRFPAHKGDLIEIIYSESNNTPLVTPIISKDGKIDLTAIKIIEGRITKYIVKIPQSGLYYIKIVNYRVDSKVFDYSLAILGQKASLSAPEILNFSVTQRDKNSVLANIKISTSGLPTTLKIEYGQTDKYGHEYVFDKSYIEDLSLSDFNIALLEKIPGITSGKYHFRLAARNSKGTTYSNDCEIVMESLVSFISESEPNPTKQQATQLYYGDSVFASISSSGDIDYYKFSADISDTIDVIFDDSSYSSKEKGSIDLWSDDYLYPIGSVQTIDDKSELRYIISKAGTYYLAVKPFSGVNSFNYSFTLNKFKPSAPKIMFFYYRGISCNFIILLYSILTNGLPTSIEVEYGTTVNYGRTYSFPGNSSNLFLSEYEQKLIGLEPGTSYHFRLTVKNNMGSFSSGDNVITTMPKASGFEILPYQNCYDFSNIIFCNPNILATSIPNHNIIKSSDFGKSWSSCVFVDGSENYISTFDKTNVMAISYGGTYRSSDGGNNWTLVSNNSFNPTSVCFLNSTTAYSTGYIYTSTDIRYYISKTSDGGVTWFFQLSGIKNPIYHVSFFNENKGFAVGNKGMIFEMKPGTDTWQVRTIDSLYYFNRISFIDINKVFIVGYRAKGFSKTKESNESIADEDYSSLILRTTNGGISWERIPVPFYNMLRYIDFYDKNNGIITGDGGLILKTTDGGNTWIEQPSGTNSSLFSSCFIDANNVIIGGTNGVILKGVFNSSPILEKMQFGLSYNYPNPFNSQTNIEYSIPEDALVKIKIYDILGRETETILNENKKAGKYGISWEPKGLATGIYYYRIEAGIYKETKKLLYLK